VRLQNVMSYSLTGNIFRNCNNSIYVGASSGLGVVFGNATVGTINKSLLSSISGTATLVGGATTNAFDKQ
jgi:hypothetical protein